jgi:hypothetical protein
MNRLLTVLLITLGVATYLDPIYVADIEETLRILLDLLDLANRFNEVLRGLVIVLRVVNYL